MEEKELPEGWIYVTLGDVAKWGSGGTPKRGNSEYYNGSIPWIKTGDLNNSNITEASEFITEIGLNNSSAKIFPKDSIAIAMYGATIGKTGRFKINAATNQACAVGLTNEKTTPSFLHYYLKHQKQAFIDKGKGGAQPNISQTVIKAHPFPLPPLPEQKRIVAKLDKVFGHLEVLKEKLAGIPQMIAEFRQSVLTQAFKLKYDRVELQQVCLKIQDGAHHSPQKRYAERRVDTYPYVTSKNIRNNYMILSNIVFVDKGFHDSIYPRCNAEKGDILLTKDGANTGNVTLNEIDEPISLLSSVCLIKTNKDELLPSFLKYFIQSPTGFSELTGAMTGTAIKRIVLKKIKKTTIPLPPIQKQAEVIKNIEALFKNADVIEARYTALKEMIDNLPQSVLDKAFCGELV